MTVTVTFYLIKLIDVRKHILMTIDFIRTLFEKLNQWLKYNWLGALALGITVASLVPVWVLQCVSLRHSKFLHNWSRFRSYNVYLFDTRISYNYFTFIY